MKTTLLDSKSHTSYKTSNNCYVEVLFSGKDILKKVHTLSKQYYYIYGCMAWITNDRLITQLSKNNEVSFLVNEVLSDRVASHCMSGLTGIDLSLLSCDGVGPATVSYNESLPWNSPVYYVGEKHRDNKDKSLMHQKFLCFTSALEAWPEVIMIGSANLTRNCEQNLESACFLYEPDNRKSFRDIGLEFLNLVFTYGEPIKVDKQMQKTARELGESERQAGLYKQNTTLELP